MIIPRSLLPAVCVLAASLAPAAAQSGRYTIVSPGGYYAYPDDDEWRNDAVDPNPRQRVYPGRVQRDREYPSAYGSGAYPEAPAAPPQRRLDPAGSPTVVRRQSSAGVQVASLPPDADPAYSTPIDYDPKVNPRQRTGHEVVDITGAPADTITINTGTRKLYLSLGGGRAIEYGVGVGREGFLWKGQAEIGRKAFWPGWTPPPEMLLRRPELPKHMDGGMENPLGARALYLFKGGKDTLFRIHGTNEPDTIGHAVSSGCIRMMNADVMDLYNRVAKGARVNVI